MNKYSGFNGASSGTPTSFELLFLVTFKQTKLPETGEK